MTWDEIIGIIGLFGGQAAFLSALGFLIKTLIQKKIDNDLIIINSKYDKLQHEHNVKFERLHENRANAIKDLFAKIWDAKIKVNNATCKLKKYPYECNTREKEIEYEKQHYQPAIDSINVLLGCVCSSEIYFSEKIRDQLFNLAKALRLGLENYLEWLYETSTHPKADDHRRFLLEYMAEELAKVDPIQEYLRTEFQQYLKAEESNC